MVASERLSCPECKSRRVSRIVYGEPPIDEDFMQKVNRGEIYLGGCVVGEHKWHCLDCGAEWGRFDLSDNFA